MIRTETLSFSTPGNAHVVDVTSDVAALVETSGAREGSATIFVRGSTAAVTTVGFEPGVVGDLQDLFERLAPARARYHHADTAGDDNGHSHVRAGLLGPSLVVPFSRARLLLGPWQQIIFVDFDTHPRDRTLIVQVHGE